MEKIINLKGKKTIKSIKAQEHIGMKPEVTFTIKFDDEDTMIIDLSLLGEITQKVSEELDELEKNFSKKLGIGLLASLMTMGGDSKELKKFLKDLK